MAGSNPIGYLHRDMNFNLGPQHSALSMTLTQSPIVPVSNLVETDLSCKFLVEILNSVL